MTPTTVVAFAAIMSVYGLLDFSHREPARSVPSVHSLVENENSFLQRLERFKQYKERHSEPEVVLGTHLEPPTLDEYQHSIIEYGGDVDIDEEDHVLDPFDTSSPEEQELSLETESEIQSTSSAATAKLSLCLSMFLGLLVLLV